MMFVLEMFEMRIGNEILIFYRFYFLSFPFVCVCVLAAIENCPTKYLYHLMSISQNFNLRNSGCKNEIKRKINWGKIQKEKSCFKLKNE